MLLPVLVENDISAFDIDDMPSEDAIILAEHAARLQIENYTVEDLFYIDFLLRPMRYFDIHRACPFGCNGF